MSKKEEENSQYNTSFPYLRSRKSPRKVYDTTTLLSNLIYLHAGLLSAYSTLSENCISAELGAAEDSMGIERNKQAMGKMGERWLCRCNMDENSAFSIIPGSSLIAQILSNEAVNLRSRQSGIILILFIILSDTNKD
ncbi:hypothetical protein C5167_006827 [Papaver somniferum]|uniref:Uncharacterized protein n=1 Tax=Papaver somniferum TaxID=3469 RepID=A0A4Y7JHV0_PAPSO|nr:hypothetical protein C5167_006827 [Papaver somniferum]